MSLAQFEMHGAVSGEDAIGHSIAILFQGTHMILDAHSTGSALAALGALRHLRANGPLAAMGSITRLGVSGTENMKIEFRIRGLTVARAGHGANANWLGRTLTGLPIEMHWPEVLRVVFHF